MPDNHALPDAISHRELVTLLKGAPADPVPDGAATTPEATGSGSETSQRQQALDALLSRWSETSRSLLDSLRRDGGGLTEGRTAQQLMALGALQAHLAMALHAARAARR